LTGPLTDESDHLQFWATFSDEVKTWQLINRATGDKGAATPTPGNITWNINGYNILWPILKKVGFDKFFVGEASQDPLENFFGLVKYFASFHDTPTPEAFVSGNVCDAYTFSMLYLFQIIIAFQQ